MLGRPLNRHNVLENPETERQCLKCDKILSIDKFGTSGNGKYRKHICQSCTNTYLKEYKSRPENLEKVKRSGRNYELKSKFGITLEEYEQLLIQQNNVCVICEDPCPTGRNLAVDHCHTTNVVRGLLCFPCNRALGLFKDNPERFENAANYLRKQNGKTKSS